MATLHIGSAKGTNLTDAKLLLEAVQRARANSIFWNKKLHEKQVVHIRPNYNTACWCWRGTFHSVYIGADILSKENTCMKTTLSDSEKMEYVEKYYIHELAGHAKYTYRDLQVIDNFLKDLKAPFSQFNLLEDARIEHLAREDGHKFEWLKFENWSYGEQPSHWLFAIIQAEGNAELIQQYRDAWPTHNPDCNHQKFQEQFDRVLWYYHTVCKMDNYRQACVLTKAWIDEFGMPPNKEKNPSPGSNHLDSELQEMASMQGSPVKLAHLDEACEQFEMNVQDAIRNEGKPSNGKTDDDTDSDDPKEPSEMSPTPNEGPSTVRLGTGNGNLLGNKLSYLDYAAAMECVALLQKVLAPRTERRSSREPSRRLNTKAYVKGRLEFIHKVEVRRKAKKRISLVLDCSGSMDMGHHMHQARILILALSILARSNMVEGNIILSASTYKGPLYQSFSLPMSDDEISRIRTWGGEGLQNTLLQNYRLLKDADLNLIFTDGQVTDGDIDKRYFLSKGIFLTAVYTAEVDCYREKLEALFHKVVMRENAKAVLQYLLYDM